MTGEQAIPQPPPMITGDQALPQPDDIQDPLSGEWLPTLPEEVLRREALLRSCRWLFAIMAVLTVFSTGRTIYSVFSEVGFGSRLGQMAMWLVPMVIFSSLGLAKSVATFYALSVPRKMSRVILWILVVLSILIIIYTLFSIFTHFAFYAESPLMLVQIALNALPEHLIAFTVAYLAFTGPGRIVYSQEGLAYFAQGQTEKRPEIPWIAVGYIVYIGISWLVNTLILQFVSSHHP
jgi:hypothetical protein